MEQERYSRVGGGERDMNKQQDQDCRLKDMQQGGGEGQPINVQPQQRQQPHQCPRCGSHNTKFCYYNNHSLAQPRYFCKSCRRNWTQGGTLRNVPVGGSSRKRKRVENSSSFQLPQPQQPPPPSQGVVVQTQCPNLTMVKAKDPSPAMAHSMSPFYQGGGGMYLSSMVEIPSLNPSQPHHFDHSLKVGSDGSGSSSNFGFASGLNVGSLASQNQIQQSQFYQMRGREREEWSPYTPQQGSVIPSQMTDSNNNVASHSCWPQSVFINNANNMTYDSSLGSTINCSTTSISGNTEKR